LTIDPILARRGDYGGGEVRDRWHAAGLASYAGYIAGMRAVVDQWTPEQRAVAQTKPQFLGYLNIASFKEEDISKIFRGALSTLP
jgi:hypothetical protein